MEEIPVPTLGEIVAKNIRVLRTHLDMSQAGLAAYMREFGFDWTVSTVRDVEAPAIPPKDDSEPRRIRRTTVEELCGLAFILDVSLISLLGPPTESLLAIGNAIFTSELFTNVFLVGTSEDRLKAMGYTSEDRHARWLSTRTHAQRLVRNQRKDETSGDS